MSGAVKKSKAKQQKCWFFKDGERKCGINQELLLPWLLKNICTQKNISQQTVKRESDPKFTEVNRNEKKNCPQLLPCWGCCTRFKELNAILEQGLWTFLTRNNKITRCYTYKYTGLRTCITLPLATAWAVKRWEKTSAKKNQKCFCIKY